jgi:glycosyltransferase involved in cell wall biosynthesis
MNSVAYVTTTFPTLAAFIESEVHRLRARGVQVRVFTLGPVGRECQPEHRSLVPLTESVGSPWRLDGWLALLGWLVRRPHVLVPRPCACCGLRARARTRSRAISPICRRPRASRIASIENRSSASTRVGALPGERRVLAARLCGVPFSMAAHAGADLYRTRAFLRESRARRFVVGCVRGNVEMLRALAGEEARIEWLYHGVDLSRFDGQGRSRPEPRLLAVGRLAPTKGLDDAVRTLAGSFAAASTRASRWSATVRSVRTCDSSRTRSACPIASSSPARSRTRRCCHFTDGRGCCSRRAR